MKLDDMKKGTGEGLEPLTIDESCEAVEQIEQWQNTSDDRRAFSTVLETVINRILSERKKADE